MMVADATTAEEANGLTSDKRIENVIIVGGACAGYTAAVYAARADLEPLVIEGSSGAGSSRTRPTSRTTRASPRGSWARR